MSKEALTKKRDEWIDKTYPQSSFNEFQRQMAIHCFNACADILLPEIERLKSGNYRGILNQEKGYLTDALKLERDKITQLEKENAELQEKLGAAERELESIHEDAAGEDI